MTLRWLSHLETERTKRAHDQRAVTTAPAGETNSARSVTDEPPHTRPLGPQ